MHWAFSVHMITETWINDNHIPALLDISGYTLSLQNRTTTDDRGNIKRGGGIGVYVRSEENFFVNFLPDLLGVVSLTATDRPTNQPTVRPESDHSAYGQITWDDGPSPGQSVAVSETAPWCAMNTLRGAGWRSDTSTPDPSL